MINGTQAMGMMWEIIGPYVGHKPGCTFGANTPDGEYCSCGLGAAKERLREIRQRISVEENMR